MEFLKLAGAWMLLMYAIVNLASETYRFIAGKDKGLGRKEVFIRRIIAIPTIGMALAGWQMIVF